MPPKEPVYPRSDNKDANDFECESGANPLVVGSAPTRTLVDDVLVGVGFGGFQLRLLTLCATGYFAVCAELLVLTFIEVDLRHDFGVSKRTLALFAIGINVTSFLGSLGFGVLIDKVLGGVLQGRYAG